MQTPLEVVRMICFDISGPTSKRVIPGGQTMYFDENRIHLLSICSGSGSESRFESDLARWTFFVFLFCKNLSTHEGLSADRDLSYCRL
jgi:hypothetical protein